MLHPDDQIVKDRNRIYDLLASKNYDGSQAAALLCTMYCELSMALEKSKEQVVAGAGLAFEALQEDSSVPTGNTELH